MLPQSKPQETKRAWQISANFGSVELERLGCMYISVSAFQTAEVWSPCLLDSNSLKYRVYIVLFPWHPPVTCKHSH